MPTPTYDLIASNVLSSSAASVSFSSIPATYRDLVLVVNAAASNNAYMRIRVNSDTGSNYKTVDMLGDGSAAYSGSWSTAYFGLNETGNDTLTTSLQYIGIVQLLDYSATDKHKPLLYRGNNSAKDVVATAGRWENTSAINSVTFILNSTHTFSSGSSFYLYGIAS